MKYLLPLLTVIFFVACNSTKEIKDKETNQTIESNITIPPVVEETPIVSVSVIEHELNIYLEAMQTFNADLVVDLTYPKLFQVIDLDLFRQYISSMMNSTDIQMSSYTTNVTNISQVKSFSNGTEFAQVEYTSTITLQFLNPLLYETEKKMNYLYDVQIHKYGTENVFIDVEQRLLRVTKPEKLLMIKEKDTQWKFVGDNERYRKHFPNFMPLEILQNIN